MGRYLGPIAFCSQAFTVLRTGFSPSQSPHLLLHHLSAASFAILSPAPCPGAPAATQAPSINNCSGPTDHSPTMGPALCPPGHALRIQWPSCWVSGQELQGGNTNFPPRASQEGSQRASGLVGRQAGIQGPWVRLESQYLQGGRGEILPFCTPVTSSRAPSWSGPLPRWGPVRSPLRWGAPPGAGWTQAGAGLRPAP